MYNLYIRCNFKIIKPSWRYVWFNKYHQATFGFSDIQYIWTDYTDIWKDSSHFVSLIHKISIFSSTILFISPNFFLMELIIRCKKITLLRQECLNRFKVTFLFSSYFLQVVDALVRGPIYLLKMLRTRSYPFQNT